MQKSIYIIIILINQVWESLAAPTPTSDPLAYLTRNVEAKVNVAEKFPWPTGVQPAIDAWNCNEPTNIQDFVFDSHMQCNIRTHEVKKHEERFTLLQDTEVLRFKGVKCVLRESRRVQQCGGYDHMAHLNWKTFFNRRVEMSHEACRLAAEDGKFVRYDGETVSVNKRGISMVNYDAVGGSWSDDDGEIQCNGEKTYVDGVFIYDAVVHAIHEIEIRDDSFVEQNGIVRSELDDLHLPCTATYGKCETLDGTFVWDTNVKDDCPVKRLREFQGTITETSAGTVVSSNTEDKIRLRRGQARRRCGKIIYETSLKNVYLDIVSTGYEWEDINPRDMSITKYTDAKDEWLFHYIMQVIELKSEEERRLECAKTVDREAFRHGIRTSGKQGRVWALDAWNSPGEFALTAGHTIYTFACQKTTVMPRPAPYCYQELPVTMLLRNGKHSKKFLDPVFNMLVDHGTQIPCSTTFAPKFRTNSDAWITASPQIKLTKAPVRRKSNISSEYIKFDYEEINLTIGGIYNETQLEMLNDVIHYDHLTQAIMNKLRDQIDVFVDGSPIAPEHMFPPNMVDVTTWRGHILGVFSPIVAALSYFGYGSSIFVAVSIIIFLCNRFINLAMLATALHEMAGCGWHFIMILCPSAMIMDREVDRAVARNAAKRPSNKRVERYRKSLAGTTCQEEPTYMELRPATFPVRTSKGLVFSNAGRSSTVQPLEEGRITPLEEGRSRQMRHQETASTLEEGRNPALIQQQPRAQRLRQQEQEERSGKNKRKIKKLYENQEELRKVRPEKRRTWSKLFKKKRPPTPIGLPQEPEGETFSIKVQREVGNKAPIPPPRVSVQLAKKEDGSKAGSNKVEIEMEEMDLTLPPYPVAPEDVMSRSPTPPPPPFPALYPPLSTSLILSTEQPNVPFSLGSNDQAQPEAHRSEEQSYDEAPLNPRPVESHTLTRIGHSAGEPPK